jgi:hypothetical protein
VELVDQPAVLFDQVGTAIVEDPQYIGVSFRATGRKSPWLNATHAAAAASMRSFLHRPPRESSRTRAVAVDGTSTTASPRLMSH